MTEARPWQGALLVAWMAVLSACSTAPSPSPAATEPAESEAPGGFALDCQPIELRAPTGEVVDLTGKWAGSGILGGDDEIAWLNQIGDCVFGSVIAGEPLGDLRPGEAITNLTARIGADFMMDTDMVVIAQDLVFPFGEHSTLVMVIEWDDEGRLRLREDRPTGATAGRCIQTLVDCPAPVIWYRVDDSPPPPS